MKKYVPWIIIVILTVLLFTDCSSPAKRNGLKAYNQLPLSTRQALENKNLNGEKYCISIEKNQTMSKGITDAIDCINEEMLTNGATTAENQKDATLIFNLSSSKGLDNSDEWTCVDLRKTSGHILFSITFTFLSELEETLEKTEEELATENRTKLLLTTTSTTAKH